MTMSGLSINPMDAIVTAGGIPVHGDPLFEITAGKPKALLDFGGKPMIQWVLDALSQSKRINRVVVIGLPPFTELTCSHALTVIDNQGSMLANLQAGVNELQKQGNISQKVLAVSSDVPAVTGDMFDWMVETVQQTDHDLYYNVISREVMEAAYPDSKRTFLKLKDVEVCGGDINAFDHQFLFTRQNLFDAIIGSRKSPIRQASILGFDTLFLVLLHKMTLLQAEINVSKKVGSRAHAILCPYAEMGMDVDKPQQYEQVLSGLRASGAFA
jgi:molybdopterin-guanine dinucleotide biosynthesis protein A